MITLGGHEFTLSSKFIRNVLLLALGVGLLQIDATAAGLLHPQSFSPSAILVAIFQPQPQIKSKIEQEVEKKNTASSKTEVNKKPRTGVHSGSGSTRYSGRNESTITILSDVPGTEISIDGTSVGKIGENKRLTTKLKKGQHKATASLKGYNSQSITISVFAESSTHSISLGKPIPAPVPLPTPIASAAPSPEPPPSPPLPSADDIIRRFINPNETSKLRSEDWTGVVAQSEETLNKEPVNAQVTARLHLALGQLAYLNRNYAESLSEFNRAIEALPLSGIAYYALGNSYLATNQPQQANKAYQKAGELTPEAAAVAQKGIGDGLTKLAKSTEANISYKRARDLGYLSPDINKSIAVNLIAEKQWQKALSELSAIEDTETSAEIQLYLGECYENLKRPLSAYRAYSTASKLDPNSTVAFSKLGNLLYELNEFPEAKEAYERALALDTTGVVINRQMVRKLADRAASLAK
jgi:Tfp pilus assembly protein PilF